MNIPITWQENEYWVIKLEIDCEFFKSVRIDRLIEYYKFLIGKLEELRNKEIRFPLFEKEIEDFNLINALYTFSDNVKKHILFIVEQLIKKGKILDELVRSQTWIIHDFKRRNYPYIDDPSSEISRDMDVNRLEMDNMENDESIRQDHRQKYEAALDILKIFPEQRFNATFWEYKKKGLQLQALQRVQKELLSIVNNPRI